MILIIWSDTYNVIIFIHLWESREHWS